MQKSQHWRIGIAQLLVFALFLAICEWAVRTGMVSTLYLAAPTDVLQVLFSYFTEDPIYYDIYVTLSEFLTGFFIAAVTGVLGGVILGISPQAERFMLPFVAALMAIPNVTIIPLLTLWLGIGFSQKVTIVFLFCFFTILYNTLAGVKKTDENLLKIAYIFEASKWQVITKVLIPSAIPTIFAGFRLAAASGLVGALFGEMLASRAGLGNQLTQAVSLFNTSHVFALIALVTAISLINIGIVNVVERLVFPIKGNEERKG